MTLSDQLSAIASAMQNGDPTPQEIRGFEVTLAGMVWEANKAMAQAEIDFRMAKLAASGVTKSAAQAQIVAEAGPYGAALVNAEMVQRTVMELLRTCRSNQRSITEEMRMSR